MESPVIPKHPLDRPGVVKIALGRLASEALAMVGRHHLIVSAPADCTAPQEVQGRVILHCLPLTKEAADDAFRVAIGEARATRIRPAKPAKPERPP